MNLFLTKEVLYLLSYVGLGVPRCISVPPAATGPGRANYFGGEGRIRTSEGVAGRFTVCSLWPLGNLTIYFLSASRPPPSVPAIRPGAFAPAEPPFFRSPPRRDACMAGAGDGT
jgi:hypothetical protein